MYLMKELYFWLMFLIGEYVNYTSEAVLLLLCVIHLKELFEAPFFVQMFIKCVYKNI